MGAWGSSGTRTPEEKLAIAIIATAFNDLMRKKWATAKGERFKIWNDAHRWFFEPCPGFRLWCEIAGYDMDFIRAKAKEIAAGRVVTARAPYGSGKRYLERKRYREKYGK